MSKRRTTDFDAIVIGAGHNGLVTAAYLARAGLTTLVIEARDEVGGTAGHEMFHGSVVNVCNCDHLTFRSTPISDELDLARHGLSYLDLTPSQINIDWSSGKAWALSHDLEHTLESLATAHPDSVESYRRYAATMIPVVELVLRAAVHGWSRRGIVRAVAERFGKGSADLLTASRRSAAEVMRGFFDNDAVIGPAMVEGPVVWGTSPETPGTGLGALSYALRHVVQVGRPVGGSGQLPLALKSAFLSAGGMLRLGTKAVGILCEGSKVVGVQTSDGATVTSSVVVSACDPRRTFVQWLKNAPPSAQETISRWSSAPVQEGYESKIDILARDIPVPANCDHLGLDRSSMSAATMVVSPSLNELHRGAVMLADGRTMPRMAYLSNCPSAIDSTLTSDGQHVVSLEALFTPYGFVDGWQSRDEPERWIHQWAELVQPGFTESIIDWRVATPITYEEQFHLPRGHATSYAAGPLATLLGKDRELSRYETVIDGLFLTGAATFPGAGIWGASGRNVAKLVIRRHS